MNMKKDKDIIMEINVLCYYWALSNFSLNCSFSVVELNNIFLKQNWLHY